VTGLQTQYEFVLPRGYLDNAGALHKRGVMRLATARDELEPLRDPTVNGPDDPRLTILVLARVVQTLGTLELVTPHEIEGLFAADLAYLQDFYGVINFGSLDDIDALLAAQEPAAPPSPPAVESAPEGEAIEGPGLASVKAVSDRPRSRRAAIEEIPASGR
jgi:hypothetical protein